MEPSAERANSIESALNENTGNPKGPQSNINTRESIDAPLTIRGSHICASLHIVYQHHINMTKNTSGILIILSIKSVTWIHLNMRHRLFLTSTHLGKFAKITHNQPRSLPALWKRSISMHCIVRCSLTHWSLEDFNSILGRSFSS